MIGDVTLMISLVDNHATGDNSQFSVSPSNPVAPIKNAILLTNCHTGVIKFDIQYLNFSPPCHQFRRFPFYVLLFGRK